MHLSLDFQQSFHQSSLIHFLINLYINGDMAWYFDFNNCNASPSVIKNLMVRWKRVATVIIFFSVCPLTKDDVLSFRVCGLWNGWWADSSPGEAGHAWWCGFGPVAGPPHHYQQRTSACSCQRLQVLSVTLSTNLRMAQIHINLWGCYTFSRRLWGISFDPFSMSSRLYPPWGNNVLRGWLGEGVNDVTTPTEVAEIYTGMLAELRSLIWYVSYQ